MLEPERGERLVVGKVLDREDDVAEMLRELRGQPGNRRPRDGLDRVGIGGFPRNGACPLIPPAIVVGEPRRQGRAR
ncbi:hypothetical protein QP162_18945 [Sphingomonas aurantiaca]|uniref:hypothetical protein n=1 Tax=Sphingomonas aurantiaca TaxID=185949 RepID=UPI002FE4071A